MTEHTTRAWSLAAVAALFVTSALVCGIGAGLVVFWAVVTDDMSTAVWTIASALWMVAFAATVLFVARCVVRLHRLGRQR